MKSSVVAFFGLFLLNGHFLSVCSERICIINTGNAKFDNALKAQIEDCQKKKKKIEFQEPLDLKTTKEIVDKFYATKGYSNYTSRYYDESQLWEVGAVLKAAELRCETKKKYEYIFTAANSFYDVGKPSWCNRHHYASIPIAMWYVETKYKRTKGLQVHDEHAYILEPFDDEALAIKQNSEYKNAELLCFDGLSDETRRIGSSMLPIDLDILEEKNQFRILNIDLELPGGYRARLTPKNSAITSNQRIVIAPDFLPATTKRRKKMNATTSDNQTHFTIAESRSAKAYENGFIILSADKKATNGEDIIALIAQEVCYWEKLSITSHLKPVKQEGLPPKVDAIKQRYITIGLTSGLLLLLAGIGVYLYGQSQDVQMLT